MRTTEHLVHNRLDFVGFVPGAFHIKMAATDAFWWTHVEPKAGMDDPTGFFEYIHHLRPKETGKFTSAPGFCRLHDTIHHAMWVDVLDCWKLEARSLGHNSLEVFANAKPSWTQIIQISEQMIGKYLPGTDFGDIREQHRWDHDVWFENHALRKQHGLLYLELCHSMNHGDVGRMLCLFPYWIAFFKSTGKHKYAPHMIRFLTDLDHVYPPQLR